jgi:hypothetical protein
MFVLSMNPKNSMRVFVVSFFALALTHCSLLITYDRSDTLQTDDGGSFPDIISPVTEVGVGGMCSGTSTRCGNLCVDTRTNTGHCGACGQACDGRKVCSNGTCVCPSRSVEFEGTCVSTASDPRNCGAAGRACAPFQLCVQGVCACQPGWAMMGGRCINLRSDGTNCGMFGRTCSSMGMGMGQSTTCVAGNCSRGSCGNNTTNCNNACVDTDTDERHCGRCNGECAGDQLCVRGTCQRYYVPANCRSCPCDCPSSRSCCLLTTIQSLICIEGGCR